MNGTSKERHDWLERATVALRKRFEQKGFTVPASVRVSIGWPRGRSGAGNKAIGQCWYEGGSFDRFNEIFISPALGVSSKTDKARLAASCRIIDVLAHELCHSIAGSEGGHKAPFKRLAVGVGLEGKMTATTATAEFTEWATKIVDKLGYYPAGVLNEGTGSGRKKQTTRLIKCSCEDCGYTVRTTQKWIAEAGAPICPTDEIVMEVE